VSDAASRAFFRPKNLVLARELERAIRTGRPLVLLLPIAPIVAVVTLGAVAVRGMIGAMGSPGAVAYQIFFSLAYFVSTLVMPALAAFDFASEREMGTWDALVMTALDVREIVRGKFWMNQALALALVLMLAPISFICPLLDGATVGEVGVALFFLGLVATLATAYGCVVGAWARSSGWAVVAAVGSWAVGAPLLFGGAGIALSMLAHGTWPAVPPNTPVWLPLAFARAPLNGTYVLLLLAMPSALAALGLWLFYLLTLAGLQNDAEDRTTGLKCWYLAALPPMIAIAAVPGFMTRGVARLGAWLGGLGGIFGFLLFATFMLAGDAWEPSPTVERRWEQERAGWLSRMLGPGLVQTLMLVLVSGLLSTAMFSLVGAAALSTPGTRGLPAPPAVALLLCGETWGAFYAFIVGFLLWARARSESVRSARLVSLFVAALAATAPFLLLGGARLGIASRAHDLLLLASASPLYALVVVRSILEGEPHLAMVTSIACSLGWVLLGVTLFAFGARRATRIVAVRRRARLEASLYPEPSAPLR